MREDFEGMVVVHGTLFKFNDARDQLITYDLGIVTNLASLECSDDHYLGRYSEDDKFIVPVTGDYPEEVNLFPQVKIPKKVVEARTLSEKEIQAFNLESEKKKNGYFIVDKDLSKILNGELPEINLDGNPYIIDTVKGEIRLAENADVKFTFSRLDCFNPSIHYYHTQIKRPLPLSKHITEFPQDVVALKFPPLFTMDVLAFARLNHVEFTKSYLTNDQNTAKDIQIIELQKTDIPELVRRNQLENEFLLSITTSIKAHKTPSDRKRGIS